MNEFIDNEGLMVHGSWLRPHGRERGLPWVQARGTMEQLTFDQWLLLLLLLISTSESKPSVFAVSFGRLYASTLLPDKITHHGRIRHSCLHERPWAEKIRLLCFLLWSGVWVVASGLACLWIVFQLVQLERIRIIKTIHDHSKTKGSHGKPFKTIWNTGNHWKYLKPF